MTMKKKLSDITEIAEGLGFDPDALREKYRQERDKRLHPDGIDQFVEIAGDFSRYVDDPYVDPGFTRAPIEEGIEVLIAGGGFAGLSMAAQLRMAGWQNLRIIEKAGDFGGTWYWNRYPGAQCDIETYCYLPLLEETGYIPTEKYAYAPEILDHARRIGRMFELYDDALFQTEITEMRWLEDESSWLCSTNRGDAIKARFVVQTNGILDRPKLPGILGINRFKGHTFHTSRWDYAYTGGDTNGGLDKLADKRIALIGTGATAIQTVPHLGRDAKQLYVFQRTPSSVDERGNGPTDPEWAKSLTPGWQKRRRRNFVALTSGLPQDEDLVGDGWTEAARNVGGLLSASSGETSPEQRAIAMELADFQKMNALRARIDSIVKNKATAEALKPWYRQFCKRPTFSDEYLSTFNLSNVTLVDTQGRGPDAIVEKGIVFDGKEYEVDCIIFATGFEVGTSFARRMGFDTYGRNGRALSTEWSKGLRSLHGVCSHNFPNLFHMGINQNAPSYCVTYHLDEQAEHIVQILEKAKLCKARLVEATQEAERAWVATIRSKSGATLAFQQACTPSYLNNEGKADGPLNEIYGGGSIEFSELIRDWCKSGMPGLQFD